MKNQQYKLIFYNYLIFLQSIKIIYGYEEFGQRLDYISLPYREIKNVSCISRDASFICDCHNVGENLFLPQLNGNVFQILIKNCDSLTVGPDLLKNVQGFTTVTFQNIIDLILQENSLQYRLQNSYNKLKFEQVKSIEINSHAISGNIDEITFESSGISNIQAFGIQTKSQTGIIKFDSVYVAGIQPPAFKRFTLDQLIIQNTIFTLSLPSFSFNEIKAQQLFIQNVTFDEVHDKAFQFEELNKVAIRDNNFNKVNSEWLSAGVKSGIIMEGNNFGETSSNAFAGLSQHKDYKQSIRVEFRFNENKIHQTLNNNNKEILPLEFNDKFNLMIRNLTYLNEFPCEIKNKLKPDSFYKIFADTIYFPSKEDSSKLLTVKKILQTECDETSYLAYIIGGSVSLIILLIVIAIITIWYIMKKRAAQKLNINPEPRTYEETQIVLKVENAGLLKTDL